VSESGAAVFAHELGAPLDLHDGPSVVRAYLGETPPNVLYHHVREFEVPVASGSCRHDGMVVAPCSMGALGRIASGASSNLIERAAEVCLKERRRLVLVPRETPYSRISLRNMLEVHDAGAVILPASPGFYSAADTVERLVDFVVSRVLDHLGVENDLMQRYGEPAKRRHPEDEGTG
jgi:4-hydroxy-3-polyprenylbenzoate decarboxylase